MGWVHTGGFLSEHLELVVRDRTFLTICGHKAGVDAHGISDARFVKRGLGNSVILSREVEDDDIIYLSVDGFRAVNETSGPSNVDLGCTCQLIGPRFKEQERIITKWLWTGFCSLLYFVGCADPSHLC